MAKFDELYQGSMVAVARKGNSYFFKRNDSWIATNKGASIIEADRANGRRVLGEPPRHKWRGFTKRVLIDI